MCRILLLLAGLILICIAIYWPVGRYPFVDLDDSFYVYENAYVQHGFSASSIRYAFTTHTMGNWNPLLWISFFVDRALFHARPGPMHIENVLMHFVGGCLLWWLCVRATGEIGRSWVVAALFLCHPLHVESVAWISERKDVLSTPLLLGAMISYVIWCQKPASSRLWPAYVCMLGLYILSLSAKTMGVTLPAVLLLMDYWPLRRWPNRSWVQLAAEKIPLLAIAMGASVVGAIAQGATGATASLATMTMATRISNALVCYEIYAAKLLIPMHLSIFYSHPGQRDGPTVFAALMLLILFSLFAFRLRRRAPYLIVGWLWFLGTLVPVIGLVQIGAQAMADRYSYLPSIGLFIAFVWGMGDLLRRFNTPDRLKSSSLVPTLLAACSIAAYSVVAHIQLTYWRDSTPLFEHALAVSDDSAVAHTVLGNMAFQRKDIHKAVDEYNAALKHGAYAAACYGRGSCWLADDPARASVDYKLAVETDPQSVSYRIGYATSLRLSKNLDEARRQIHLALDMDPNNASAKAELDEINKARP